MPTCAGGEVLLADVNDRVDDTIDGLAERKGHGGFRVQNRPLREQMRTSDGVLALHANKREKSHSEIGEKSQHPNCFQNQSTVTRNHYKYSRKSHNTPHRKSSFNTTASRKNHFP